EPRLRHPLQRDQFLDPRRVDQAPDAVLLPRREPVRVALVVDAFLDAVDPAETQRFVDRLLVADARLPGGLLVEADQQLTLARVVRGEPAAELRRSLEVRSFH